MADEAKIVYPPNSPSQKTGSFQLKDSEHQNENQETIPDGGLKAWMTVCGAWWVLFGTYGYIYAFGVYQDYYTRFYLSNRSPSVISWIGSLQYTMPFLLGIVSGKLFDKGTFYTLEIIGGALYVFSLFMLSLAKKDQFYQIFLAQGLGMGLGLGLLFIPTLGITTHHFKKKRALAGGIALSGSAIGAIIFPIMLNQLLQRKSFGESVRATAYVVLGSVVIGNLLMRTRLSPAHKDPPPIKEFFSEPSYIMLNVAGILISFGLLFPTFYIQLYAVEHRLDTNLAFYSIAIINAASVIGRIVGNHIADLYGPINILIPSAAGTALSIWLVLAINNSASLVIISILYGVFSGSYLSLVVATLASVAKHPSHIGSKTGIALAISSLSLLGSTPIHGALLTSTFKWIRPITFSGTFVTVAVFFFIMARQMIAKERGTQRV